MNYYASRSEVSTLINRRSILSPTPYGMDFDVSVRFQRPGSKTVKLPDTSNICLAK